MALAFYKAEKPRTIGMQVRATRCSSEKLEYVNVTFHVLTGIGVAASLSPRKPPVSRIAVVAGLASTICLHGLLDYVPHSYPIKSSIDVALALLLFGAALSLAKPHLRLLLVTCFLGSILPDLIDLAPGILNRHVGLNLPEVKLFPWHWRQYSGSVHDGSRMAESMAAHLLVSAVALFLIWRARDRFGAWSTTR